jgi:hypothetical protein
MAHSIEKLLSDILEGTLGGELPDVLGLPAVFFCFVLLSDGHGHTFAQAPMSTPVGSSRLLGAIVVARDGGTAAASGRQEPWKMLRQGPW